MKKNEVEKTLRHLHRHIMDEARLAERTCIDRMDYLNLLSQANGVRRAAEALELQIVPFDKQEPDHPDTLLPLK